ncbi:MAG: hypothetical protein R6W81_10175 [Bacteroidales bacterium]
MKVTLKISVITLLLTGSALFLNSCKKDPVPPTVTTANVSSITRTTASSGGNVTADGGAEVTARGVCWNTSENPVVSNSKTSDGTGIGIFTSNLAQLTPGTRYYVRAYATNSAGTAYGNQQTFTTDEILLATVTTAEISTYSDISAVSGGPLLDRCRDFDERVRGDPRPLALGLLQRATGRRNLASAAHARLAAGHEAHADGRPCLRLDRRRRPDVVLGSQRQGPTRRRSRRRHGRPSA